MNNGDLVKKTITVFRSNKNITEVSTYGSLSDGKSDIYSDIDLIVKTDKPKKLLNLLPSVLTRIDDYYIALPIQETSKEAVYTIMWKNIPFYQIYKPINFPFDENLRFFYDYLIGVTRMVKYCKRNMFWAAYKFYEASFEMLLKLKLESLDGKPRLNISLQDYMGLDGANVDYSSYLSFSIQDSKILEITNDFLKLSLKMNKISKSSNEYDFAKKVIKFTANELGTKSGGCKADTLPNKHY